MSLLDFPEGIAPSSDSLTMETSTAMFDSIYTGQQQVQQFGRQLWRRQMTFPPMPRDKASALVAFIGRLKGRYGRFRCGMFSAKVQRGNPAFTMTVGSWNENDNLIAMANAPANRSLLFAAGDYFQVNDSLFMCLEDVSTGNSSNVEFEVFPKPTESRLINIGVLVKVENPQGIWRLDSDQQGWSIDSARNYGLSLSMLEAVS